MSSHRPQARAEPCRPGGGERQSRVMTTTIHLGGPADMLAVLPYQLGFHPRHSLLAVSLRPSRSGTRIGLVQRIDLPPPEHIAHAVAAMMVPLRADLPQCVLLVGFEERAGESLAMLDQMASTCKAFGVEVSDRLVVRDGRWYAPYCGRRCCPAEGLPLPPASEVPAVAEFVGRGICPLPDRSALARRLEPDGASESGRLSGLVGERLLLRRSVEGAGAGELADCRAKELQVWARVLWGSDEGGVVPVLPSRDLAILAVSLTDVGLRDALIAWLCPGSLARELIDPMLSAQLTEALGESSWLERQVADADQVSALQRIEGRLCEVCASLPDLCAVPALTVLATFTWWRGDGAMTRVALDRALRIDPHYRLAELLEEMVDLAIRPERESA